MSFYWNDSEDRPRIGSIVLTVVGFFVLLGVISLGVWGFNYFTAETRGRVDLHNEARSASELRASYEYFHDTCRDVIAKGQQIDNIQARLDSMVAPASDPFGNYATQRAQVETQLTGVKNLRDGEAQEYNAKSHEFTHNFMRSSDLPDEIGAPNGTPYESLECER